MDQFELCQKEHINPFALSKQYLLVVTFVKSSSKNFQAALLWARSAKIFENLEIEKKPSIAALSIKQQNRLGWPGYF